MLRQISHLISQLEEQQKIQLQGLGEYSMNFLVVLAEQSNGLCC